MRRVLSGVLFLGVACGHEPTAPVARASFTTDKILYVATVNGTLYTRYTVTVIARYANEGVVPIQLGTCNVGATQPIYSVRLVGDTTDNSAFNPWWGCVGGAPPLTIAPGQVRTDTLELLAPNGWTSAGVPMGVFDGQVQISYASTATAASNVFTIQLPQ
jgi:hypothetical protein